MSAAGDLRDDAAVFSVQVVLRGDDMGPHVYAIGDHGRGGLVTTGLDAEDQGHVDLVARLAPFVATDPG